MGNENNIEKKYIKHIANIANLFSKYIFEIVRLIQL